VPCRFAARTQFIQFDQALPRPFHIDAALAPLSSTVLAKTCERRAAIESAVTRADGVIEWPLSLRAPHNPVNLVRLDVVLDQRVEELTHGNEHSDHELRRKY
jgi:hypothetical protein